MQTADRLKQIPPYLFMELRNKIAKARAAGVDVISLAIGYPTNRPGIPRPGGPPLTAPPRANHAHPPRRAHAPAAAAPHARPMSLSYPTNPRGPAATPAFLRELVSFARQYDITICYDNP